MLWRLSIPIDDVLDFSRIEAGRLELEEIDFTVPEVLEQVRSILAPQAADHSLELDFAALPHAALVVHGDPTRLTQVLINLVGNGIKFTAQGGVTVSTHCTRLSEQHVRLRFEVHDTGSGTPKDQPAALFQAFVQAAGTATRRFGASGLGLAICRRLVGTMGGTIGIESGLGQGSLFWFELPLALGSARASPSGSALSRRTPA